MTLSTRFVHRARRAWNRQQVTRVVSAARRAHSSLKRGSMIGPKTGLKMRLRPKTRTFHKRKLTEKVLGGVGGTSTLVRHRIGRYPATISKVLKDINVQCYTTNQVGQLNTTVGIQAAQAQFGVLDIGDLEFIRTNIAFANAGNQNNVATFQRDMKVHYLSATSKTFYTNMSNRNVKMYLYDVVCRRDSVINPVQSWIGGVQDVTNNVAGGNAVINVPGLTPFASPAFTAFWRVLKISDITLPAGSVHTHTMSITVDKVDNSEAEYRQSVAAGGSLVNLKDWTHFTIIIIHGFPALDSASHANPSSGAAEIAYNQTISYTFKMLDGAVQANNVFSNNYPTSFAGGEAGVGEESDLIGAYVQT